MNVRTFLAKAIAGFARTATFSLSPTRRAWVMARVRADLEPKDSAVRIETALGPLRCFGPSPSLVRRAHMFHRDEADVKGWIDGLPDGAVLWDIGANIGMFSIYAALKPGVRVVAFEPSANSYAVLNRNVDLNGMADKISAYAIALAGSTKCDVLNLSDVEAGAVMHGFATERNQLGGIIETRFRQGAVGFSIDDFVRLCAPVAPTHVKIDVDGIEADILRGGRNTLTAPGVQSVIVEIEGDLQREHNREIFGLMEELGFRARPKSKPEYRNVIFDR